MDEIQVKKVQDESYESLAKLLDKTVENLETIGVPAFIQYAGKKYLVSYSCGNYSFVNEDEDYVISVDKDNELIRYIDGGKIYMRANVDGKLIAELKYLGRRDYSQLFMNEANEVIARPTLNFYQKNENDEGLNLVYDLFRHENNIESYLNYISNKKPSSFEFDYLKKFGPFIYDKIDFYYYLESLDIYLRKYFPNKKFSVLGLHEGINEFGMHRFMSDKGFSKSPDETLCQIFTKSYPKTRVLTKMASEYDAQVLKNK